MTLIQEGRKASIHLRLMSIPELSAMPTQTRKEFVRRSRRRLFLDFQAWTLAVLGMPFFFGMVAYWSVKFWHPSPTPTLLVSVITTVVLIGVFVARLMIVYKIREVLDRELDGHCRECGYNLTGNNSGRCPECGTITSGKRN